MHWHPPPLTTVACNVDSGGQPDVLELLADDSLIDDSLTLLSDWLLFDDSDDDDDSLSEDEDNSDGDSLRRRT